MKGRKVDWGAPTLEELRLAKGWPTFEQLLSDPTPLDLLT